MTNQFYTKVNQDLVGKGLGFPLDATDSGRALVLSGSDLIKSSLNTLLSWTLGERFFLPEFGSRIKLLLEEPNDADLENLLYALVPEAIAQWEPRVEIVTPGGVSVVRDGEKVNMVVSYTLTNTNTQDSFVFPLYTNIIY